MVSRYPAGSNRPGRGDGEREPSGAVQRADPGEPRPSVAVVEAVARVRDCEPTDLEPLVAVVDPDALDVLAAGTSQRDDGPRVEFEYEGVAVEVRGGEVLVAADRR